MRKGIKGMLLPNKKQYSKLLECAGVNRFAYNWALAKEHVKLEKLTQSKKKKNRGLI